jgi:hypothetical protein
MRRIFTGKEGAVAAVLAAVELDEAVDNAVDEAVKEAVEAIPDVGARRVTCDSFGDTSAAVAFNQVLSTA